MTHQSSSPLEKTSWDHWFLHFFERTSWDPWFYRFSKNLLGPVVLTLFHEQNSPELETSLAHPLPLPCFKKELKTKKHSPWPNQIILNKIKYTKKISHPFLIGKIFQYDSDKKVIKIFVRDGFVSINLNDIVINKNKTFLNGLEGKYFTSS